EIITEEGTTIAVGDLMCTIDTVEDGGEETKEESSPSKESTESKTTESVDDKESGKSMKNRFSPAVMRLAQENDIDLTQVSGTGAGGRITRKDIEKVIKEGVAKQERPTEPSKPSAPVATSAPTTAIQSSVGDTEIPVTGIRKAIAANMVRAKQEIPHAWMTVEVDVTDLVTYRNKIKEEFKDKEGFNVTYFAFFVKAVAQSLKEYPELNSTWAEDKIIQRKDINLSIAVAKDDQLFVPVIKHADEKSVKGIARDVYDLAMKARS